jgi:L-iditol 2-dehydrogenase
MKVPSVGTPGAVRWIEVDEPQIGPGEVLLQSLACGICTTDVKMVRRGSQNGRDYGLGHELVGRIVAAGDGTRWPIGKRVVAAPYVPCGVCAFCLRGQLVLCERLFEQGLYPGGLAERVRIPRPIAERGLFAVPDSLPSDIASLTEPIACCLQAAEACSITAGDAVLIVGDGPMGLMNAAVARIYGASLIIVAGLTPRRLKVAAEHYADAIVNVVEEDLTQRVKSMTQGRGADVVLVAVSSPGAVISGLDALRRGGILNVFAGVPGETMVPLDLRRLHYDELRITGSFGAAPQHLSQALCLLSRGQVNAAPLITGCFSFEQTPAAIEHAANQVGMKAVVVFQ